MIRVIKLIIKKIIFNFNNFLFFISREGSWSLSALERQVLDKFLENAEGDVIKFISMQLNQDFFITRFNNSRIVTICYFEYLDSHRITDQSFSEILYKIELKVNEKKEYVHLVFYNGYLDNIEFKHSKEYYINKEINIENVVRGKITQSHSAALDRLEHGNNKDS